MLPCDFICEFNAVLSTPDVSAHLTPERGGGVYCFRGLRRRTAPHCL